MASTAHANHRAVKTQCQWYPIKDVMARNSKLNLHKVFKLGGMLGHMTRHVRQL